MNANLFDTLARSIADPDKPAIETLPGERISYADLVARTGRFANALKTVGVGPGDRVAAQVEKSVEAIVLYLATVRAGAVFLTPSPRSSSATRPGTRASRRSRQPPGRRC
jgi:malonyl-CoA/methylmalonyl-CoA synthetase